MYSQPHNRTLSRTLLLTAALLAPSLSLSARAQQTPPPPVVPSSGVTSPQSLQSYRSGIDAFKKGDLALAVSEMEKAVASDPKNGDAQNWLGYLYMRQGKSAAAIPHLEKAIELRPGVAEPYTNLGNALLAKPGRSADDTRRAVEMFRKAAEVAPKSSEAQFNLGVASARVAQYDTAAAAYRRAVELNPKDGRAWTNLGFVLQRLGRKAEAVEALKQGAALGTPDAQTWATLGALELESGDRDAALNALETARKLDPKNDAALLSLGRAYAEAGRTAEAAAAFGEAADRIDERAAAAATGGGATNKTPDVTARYNQGVMLAKIGKLQDALAAYEKVLTVDPRYYDALVNAGFVLFRQKRADEAMARFKTATTIRPAASLAWINLATLYTQKSDHANAAAAWRKVAALEPANYDARAFLATELTALNKPVEAIKVYEQMGRLHPQAAEPFIAVGLLFQKQADAVKTAAQKQANLVLAKQSFEEALRREPKSAIAYNNLGVVHERRGEMPEAVAAYRKAVALDPAFADAKKNLARFKIGTPAAGAGITAAKTPPALPKKP